MMLEMMSEVARMMVIMMVLETVMIRCVWWCDANWFHCLHCSTYAQCRAQATVCTHTTVTSTLTTCLHLNVIVIICYNIPHPHY